MMINRNALAAATLALMLSSTTEATPHAHYEGLVVVEWLVHQGADRGMRLVETFAFIDENGKRWEVPAGHVVDGASIPRILWSSIGSPFVGDYRRASVVHDYYCDVKTESWRDTHRNFYDAMIAAGVSVSRARYMYAAVYAFGPRWNLFVRLTGDGDEVASFDVETPEITHEEFEEIRARIEDQAVPLEEIEAYFDRLQDGR